MLQFIHLERSVQCASLISHNKIWSYVSVRNIPDTVFYKLMAPLLLRKLKDAKLTVQPAPARCVKSVWQFCNRLQDCQTVVL
jgi:hypothetical protein